MKETRIPTRADMPPYLLVWSSDECMPVLLGLGIGIMLNQVFICTTVGLVVAHFYRKFRDLHRERQKFCVHGIIGARQSGASNEHEYQTQFS